MESAPASAPRIPGMAWIILVLSSLDSVLGMIDRQAISILKVTLERELGIGDAAFGLLVSIFLVTYAIFYPVCGRLVDRFGSRVALTAFILVWSAATVLSGLASSFEQLAVLRAVLGAAEAGLVPATIAALVVWFPRAKVATAYSLRGALVALGPVLAPPVIAGLAIAYGWRAGFIVPGAAGLLFAAAWWAFNRNPPDYGEEAPSSPLASPIKAVLSSRLLWGLIAARLISDPLWFYIQYWQAGYFQEQLGLSLAEVGQLLWIPPLAAALLAIPAGTISDRLIQSGLSPVQSRVRVMQGVAVLAPLSAVIPAVANVGLSIALFALVQAMCLVWLTLSNVLVASLFPKQSVGTAVGVLNAIGTVGAAAFNSVVGSAVGTLGYGAVFVIAAVLHPAAAAVLHFAYGKRATPLPD